MNSASASSAWYKSLKQSPLTPPSWVFPIAWTILYALIYDEHYDCLYT